MYSSTHEDPGEKCPRRTNIINKTGLSHNSSINTAMANNSSMCTAGANNSMANTGDQSITSTAVADSSITYAGISDNGRTAMPNNSIKDEADEYFNSVVQYEMKVDEPPIVQPKKLSKYSRYMCGMCTKYFDKRSRLRTHLSRHHDGTNSNLCCICGWFNTKVDISAHMRSVHPWYQQCDQCQKWLSSKCRLNLHMVQIHTPTVERLQCHFCSNSFIRHKTLATHMQKFHMLFQCLECEEYFAEDEDLDEHLKMHLRLHVKQKYPNGGGGFTEKVVIEDINNFSAPYSCTAGSEKYPMGCVTADSAESQTVREEGSPSFNIHNQVQGDTAVNLVGWEGSGRVHGSGESDGGVLEADAAGEDTDMVPDTQCHVGHGAIQQIENVNSESNVHRNTDTQSDALQVMDIDMNSTGFENNLNNSQGGDVPWNTMNTLQSVNRTYVSNPMNVERTQNVNDLEADSAVDVNSILASLVESLPVDQYSNHMETCSAVQSILDIPVTEQSHQLPHTKHPFTTPSELINCSHRQRQGFVDGESRNKETSQVCQQSEASALEQQYEESHISRDHSYMMSRKPSDVISKYPSDLVTKGRSDVMSGDVSGIISTGPPDFSTTGQSGNCVIMASNDLNESSSVVISHEEVNSCDKECNSCDKEDSSNCEDNSNCEDSNNCEDSSNCSNEKDQNVCNENNNICQEDNSINEGNNSCDADCSEDNPSNNSSDKVREGHSFDSLEEDNYMDADQELALPDVQTGAFTSHSRSLEVPPTGRGWKQVRKQGLETNSGHNVTGIRSKGCCSLSCAALKGRFGRRSVHYMCGICHQIFENCEGLQRHKKAQHSLRCAACGLVCSRMIDLLTHYESCYG